MPFWTRSAVFFATVVTVSASSWPNTFTSANAARAGVMWNPCNVKREKGMLHCGLHALVQSSWSCRPGFGDNAILLAIRKPPFQSQDLDEITTVLHKKEREWCSEGTDIEPQIEGNYPVETLLCALRMCNLLGEYERHQHWAHDRNALIQRGVVGFIVGTHGTTCVIGPATGRPLYGHCASSHS